MLLLVVDMCLVVGKDNGGLWVVGGACPVSATMPREWNSDARAARNGEAPGMRCSAGQNESAVPGGAGCGVGESAGQRAEHASAARARARQRGSQVVRAGAGARTRRMMLGS